MGRRRRGGRGVPSLAVRGVVTERVAIFCGGVPVTLAAQPGGWSWAADSFDAHDLRALVFKAHSEFIPLQPTLPEFSLMRSRFDSLVS